MSTLPTDASLAPPSPVVGPAGEPEYVPSCDGLITEDHKPVDRILIEKLYRLLTHTLYASWSGPGPERPFLVLANVGWFYQEKTPAVTPDCLLSLDVSCPEDLHAQRGRSYYQWIMGKPPDVIIEVVSDTTGGEEGHKKTLYARLGVAYYAIYDPEHYLSEETLRTYELAGRKYREADTGPWPGVGLGLRLWEGPFERHHDTWLRWCDANGLIIPTAEERAQRADERVRELEEELRRLKGEGPGKE